MSRLRETFEVAVILPFLATSQISGISSTVLWPKMVEGLLEEESGAWSLEGAISREESRDFIGQVGC